MGELVKNEVKEHQLPAVSAMSSGTLPASVIENAQRATAEVLTRVWAAKCAPRDMKAFAEELFKLCGDKKFSERAMYCLPIKKKNEKGQYDDSFVEGPSVYLAKEMAARYPNFEWRLVEHGRIGNAVQFEVTAWDYERNTRSAMQLNKEIPKWAIGRENSESMTIGAAQSKCIRNVLFSQLPQTLIDQCYERARATQDVVAVELAKDKAGWLATFADELGITVGDVLKFVHLDKASDVKPADIRRLRAIAGSLHRGEIDVRDIWPDAKPITVEEGNNDDEKQAIKAAGKPSAGRGGQSKPKAEKEAVAARAGDSDREPPDAYEDADDREPDNPEPPKEPEPVASDDPPPAKQEVSQPKQRKPAW